MAAFALPAQAGAEADTQTMTAVDATAKAGDKATTLVSTKAAAPALAAPAVTAPATVSPVAAPDFGALGFKAIAKPAPDRTMTQASRSTDRTVLAPSRPAAGGVLGVAASLVGIYYSYGGTSPSTGFDCSGFTQYVFAQVGISIPRTAEDQRRAATPVSSPQPGDLVFFGIPAYHVGIYAGNGMMYDSPRTGKAVALRSVWSSDVSYGRP